MIDELSGNYPVTVGADNAYDTRDFVAGLRRQAAVPHVAQNNIERPNDVGSGTGAVDVVGVSEPMLERADHGFANSAKR